MFPSLIVIIPLILSCGLSTITNGFTLREAPENGSLDDTINVFTSMAEDKNFTIVQPAITESSNVTNEKMTTVAVKVEETKPEKEEDKPEVKPSVADETAKPSTTTSTTSPPTSSSASVSTSTVKPSNPLNVITDKPVVISINETEPFVDISFANNDTSAAEIFSSLDAILGDLDSTNETVNSLDTSSGGTSSNDEFANYFELLDKLDGLGALFEPDQ